MSKAEPPTLQIGDWTADLRAGRLVSGDEVRAVEPKVMDLLFLLASRPGEVFTREEIMEALWPGVTVGDDTLARSISKLRRALGDDAAAPRYLETIPKRGYRLLLTPAAAPAAPAATKPPSRRLWIAVAVVLALVAIAATAMLSQRSGARDTAASTAAELTRRGDDAYFQFTRADNEAAMELYRRALEADPDHPAALAGLANATVQTVIRWPEAPGRPEIAGPNLSKALATGRTRTPRAVERLARARALAERAVDRAPRDPAALKAAGFVRSAQGDFDGAMALYRRALAIDPDAWGVLINMGDVLTIRGQPGPALAYLERAYGAMSRAYDKEALRIRPWQAELGVAIAERHAQAGRSEEAELWDRRVLAQSPLHRGATVGLARLLAARGDRAGAARLCRELVERTGPAQGCGSYLDEERRR
jgi:transcriptional activator of cad operon